MSTDYQSILNTLVAPLFRDHYLPLMSRILIAETPVLNMFPVKNNATGRSLKRTVPMASIGGFSMSSIGDAGASQYLQTSYTTQKLFQIGRVDSVSIEQSRDELGAAEKLLTDTVKLMKMEFSRNKERMIIQGDINGSGSLGVITTVVDNGGGDYTLTISTSTWVRQNFQRSINVNVGASSSDNFLVTHVNRSSETVEILRNSGGTYVPQIGDSLYMAGCRNLEWTGLDGILNATSGNVFGIPSQDGWQSVQVNAAGSPISAEMLIWLAMEISIEVFQTPNCLIVPALQEKKLIKLGEANKILMYDKLEVNDFVIGCVPHLYIRGKPIPILYSPFVASDRVYFVNKEHLEINSLGDGEFQKTGGSTLWYEGPYSKIDAYTMLYREYSVPFIDPRYHGVLYNLSTTDIINGVF